jgi:hypothetical protein
MCRFLEHIFIAAGAMLLVSKARRERFFLPKNQHQPTQNGESFRSPFVDFQITNQHWKAVNILLRVFIENSWVLGEMLFLRYSLAFLIQS